MFQHTAARRRLDAPYAPLWQAKRVSTHSRPKAAGPFLRLKNVKDDCFNTQPPEGGWYSLMLDKALAEVSTHSRPKAAGLCPVYIVCNGRVVSTHSRPKAAGASQWRFDRAFEFQHTAARRRLDIETMRPSPRSRFQHTAARRRLVTNRNKWPSVCLRFQHTAARRRLGGNGRYGCLPSCFNTQPPEGGWAHLSIQRLSLHSFNTQPPEGGWVQKSNLV